MTIRNWESVLMIILPIIFNWVAVYIAKHILEDLEVKLEELFEKKADVSEIIFPMKMYFFTIFIV